MPSLPAAIDPGRFILAGVNQAVRSRWEQAQRTAAAAAGPTVTETVENLRRSFARELAATGAAAGGIAAVPGVGTVAAIGTTASELGWFGLRSADLIMAIAAAHGHADASVEERRAWVLSVLAFGDSAASGFTKVAGTRGTGLGTEVTRRGSNASLRAANRAVGRALLKKWGTRRGVIVAGRLLPFGIGAAIGGGANYSTVRAIAGQADRFFKQLPTNPLEGGRVRPPVPPRLRAPSEVDDHHHGQDH